MKKYLLVIIAALWACAALYARGKNEKMKLVYLTPSWGAPSEELAKQFEAETGIDVEVSTLNDSDLRSKVMQAAAGRVNPADVIFVGITNLGTFGASGILKNLKGAIPESLFDRVVGVDSFQMDGAAYAVPIYQQLVMMDYDTSALRRIGLSSADIRSWDDFENAALAMKQQGLYEYPLAFAVRAFSWYLIALSSGSRIFAEEPLFDNPSDPAYKAYERLIGWFQKGLISPERLTSPNPHPSFWAGQAAFHQAWQGSLSVANNPDKSTVAPNADYLALPEQRFTWSLPAGLAISAYSKQPKAAARFIEFMLSEPVQLYAYESSGMFPAEKSVFKALQGRVEGWQAMSDQAEYVVPLPYNPPWFSEFETELNDSFLRAARGEVSAKKAIADLGIFTRQLQKEYE